MENRREGPMRRLLYLGVAAILALAFSGCGGGGGDSRTVFIADILSVRGVDGDIAFDPFAPPGSEFTITHTDTVLAGIDPLTQIEFRGFLHFPLDTIPVNADVLFASMTVLITSVTPQDSADPPIPFLIDSISFQPPILIESDFDRVVKPPLLTHSGEFFPSDQTFFVEINVTPLMRNAILNGLTDFQVRIVFDDDRFQSDLNTIIGLVRIDDGPGTVSRPRIDFAPLLHVEYF